MIVINYSEYQSENLYRFLNSNVIDYQAFSSMIQNIMVLQQRHIFYLHNIPGKLEVAKKIKENCIQINFEFFTSGKLICLLPRLCPLFVFLMKFYRIHSSFETLFDQKYVT